MKRIIALILLGLMLLMALPAQAAESRTVSWNGNPVEIRVPGSWLTVIREKGKETTMLSEDLTWESDTEVRFAYIWAPKKGKANIRLGPKSKASVIGKAETGRVVLVFSKGKQYSGIIYDGTVGYMSNTTLKFIANPTVPRATATLSFKGRTDSKTKVTMRTGAGQNTRSVTKLQPGLPVVVFKLGKTWSEVECNGWHGYVMTQHLTDIEELEPEDPGDEPAAPAVTEEPEIITHSVEEDTTETVELD